MGIDKLLFGKLYHPQIIEEAESVYRNHKIKVKKPYESEGIVKIKIIDNHNYVTHVEFDLSNNEIINFSCDGSTRYCNHLFCCHCYAALYYLKQEENVPIAFPDKDEKETKENTRKEEDKLKEDESIASSVNTDNLPDEKSGTRITEDGNHGNNRSDSGEESVSRTFIPKQMKILLGRNRDTNEDVYFYPNDTDYVMNTNIGIIGTMGTGKTQFTKSLVTQMYHDQSDNYDGTPLGILIIDYKGDYNETKSDFVKAVNARVIKPYKMPYNPFCLNLKKNNKALLPMHTANAFKDTVSKIYCLGPKQEGILFDCIMAAYKEMRIIADDESTWRRPAPTFDTVYRQYEKIGASADNDKLSMVMKKIKGFAVFDPDPLKTVSLSGLLKGVLVIDISEYDEDIQNLVVAITMDQFYAQMQNFGSSKTDGRYRQLKAFVLVDEADNFMRMKFSSLRKIMKEGREFGVGTILSTQSLAHFSGNNCDYSKYIITWFIHNVNDLNRRNIEDILNQTQKGNQSEGLFRSIKNLKKHESVVKISDEDPYIMRDKPFWELI